MGVNRKGVKQMRTKKYLRVFPSSREINFYVNGYNDKTVV